MMSREQMASFQAEQRVRPGHEWDLLEGLDAPVESLRAFVDSCPFAAALSPGGRALTAPAIPVPAALPMPKTAGRRVSTQAGFGEILAEIGRGEGEMAALADHIVTTSPDVTVSTNLGPWVNRRGIFDRHTRNDVFRDSKLASAQRWGMSPAGQHVELGIAEQNLFLMLGAAGLSHALHGARLLPVGTVYDPFVNRGLDALIYAATRIRGSCWSRPPAVSRWRRRVGSTNPSIRRCSAWRPTGLPPIYEPAHLDELGILLRHAFAHMQAPDGSAVWLRLSTRQLDQPERRLDPAAVIAGAHWAVPPAPGARIAIAYQGPVAPEAHAAFEELVAEVPGAGLLAVTSPDRLHAGWLAAQRARRAGERGARAPIEQILDGLAPGAAIVSVLDGHPAAHAWLGAVRGQRVVPLGVDRFGQGGDIPDLYRAYGLDVDAVLDACAQALLGA